jgi:Zn-dependent protease
MGWWVQDVFYNQGPVYLIAWIFWILLSITLHELAHGWAAIFEGDTTPRELGHMTANPYVHMGPISLIIFAVFGFAFGLMPVNPSRFRHRRWGDAIVALAGPAMNLLLALACLTSLGLVTGLAPPPTNTPDPGWQTFLLVGGWINIVLFLLNLIPVPPLDGSRILSCFSWKIRELYMRPQAQLVGMAVFLFIIMAGVADGTLRVTMAVALDYSDLVRGLVAG